MDPNACLQRIIDAYDDGDRAELADAVRDLDGWLSRGGFPPFAQFGEHLGLLTILRVDVEQDRAYCRTEDCEEGWISLDELASVA